MNDNKFVCKIELNLTLDQAKIMEQYLGSGISYNLEDKIIDCINYYNNCREQDNNLRHEAAQKTGPQYSLSDFIIENVPKQVRWKNKEGKTHRIDGPAILWNDEKYYYLDGEKVSQEEHARLVNLKAFW